MSLLGRSCWSWAGLALWLSQAVLASAIAISMLCGPELADRAWENGTHVTPGQAAMHAVLMAEGFTHHHGKPPLPQAQQATPQDGGPIIDTTVNGGDWGSPLLQATHVALPEVPDLAVSWLLPGRASPPAGPELSPETPPPEAA